MKNKKMSQFRNKYVGTMFGRSFALIVVIVFFSLIISGLFLLMLSGSYWKESMRDDLTGDAESLSDRLVMMMEDSLSDDLFATRDTALASVYLLQTVSACSGCDIFLTDENGRVLLCSDGEGPETDWPFSQASCPRHRGGVIPAEYLRLRHPARRLCSLLYCIDETAHHRLPGPQLPLYRHAAVLQLRGRAAFAGGGL